MSAYLKFKSRARAERGVVYYASAALNKDTKTLLALTGKEAGTKVHCRDEKHAKAIIRGRLIKAIETDGDRIVGIVTHARIEKET